MKRGGRESGDVRKRPDAEGEKPSVKLAAADPAALAKRIRALEAKLAEARHYVSYTEWARYKERAEKAEAELAIVRSKYREADMMQDALRARAEKAEAHRWAFVNEPPGGYFCIDCGVHKPAPVRPRGADDEDG